uniref:trafficking protein particle complex subunit 6A isoform X1 n=1 Tax=Nyctereutes procyonoides TaxID=34880 RepID=UPI002445010D|nr:trafficking protein particle complex subunit 6A isoform X1 [Nyctereutes procyonoides]
MADAALFEFLHTEMVAELWAHHSDPGPGGAAPASHLGPATFSLRRAAPPCIHCPGISDVPSLGLQHSGSSGHPKEIRASRLPSGHTISTCRHVDRHQGQKMSLSVLEGMGFRVGQALGERLPQETLAFREELDVLKFLCKDLWVAVFQKQMDSLRTNHQGTYVLQDNSFPLLIRMAAGLQYLEEAPKFLAFTCGLLRGALSTLGIKSLVTASVASLPTCKFQVVIQKT